MAQASGRASGAPVAQSEAGGVDRQSVFAIRRTTVVRALLIATAMLALASVAMQASAHLLERGGLLGLVPTLDMTREANLPTWFSAVVFLGAGVMAGFIWAMTREQGDPDARYWGFLTLVFVAASADEAATFHETFGEALTNSSKSLWFLGLLTALGLFVVLALWPFALRLPKALRRALALGAGTFLLGAAGLEMLELVLVDSEEIGFGIAVLNTCQDVLELLGAIIILNGLMRHAGERGYRASIGVARAT